MGRVNNSINNLISAVGAQILLIAFNFITRTVFINTLGIEYLGLNGLFSNIIMMLSLTELGFGTAIMFHLYKPIADRDEHQIALLMKFYKIVYRVIGFTITLFGLILLPFLLNLIKDPPTFIDTKMLYIIFILYLMQSVSTYLFFAYKSALLRANQKTYIITRIGYFFIIGSQIIQIITLYTLKNYVIYVSIVIISNILQNIIIARIVDKKYPFINMKTDDKITKQEIKEIIKNCYGLSLYKINGVLMSVISSLILSKFIGLAIVGIYANYQLFTNGLAQMTNNFVTSIGASAGNLNADSTVDEEKKLLVFKAINMLTFITHGTVVVCFFAVINPLITIWLGANYTLSQSFVFILCINLYLVGNSCATYIYRNAKGLFYQAKYVPVIGVITNIVVALLLVKRFQISGVLCGIAASSTITYGILDPYIIYKYGFKQSPKLYYIKNILYAMTILLCGGVVYYISNLLPISGVLKILITGIIGVFLSGLSILIFSRTKEFKYLISIVLSLVKKSKKT